MGNGAKSERYRGPPRTAQSEAESDLAQLSSLAEENASSAAFAAWATDRTSVATATAGAGFRKTKVAGRLRASSTPEKPAAPELKPKTVGKATKKIERFAGKRKNEAVVTAKAKVNTKAKTKTKAKLGDRRRR